MVHSNVATWAQLDVSVFVLTSHNTMKLLLYFVRISISHIVTTIIKQALDVFGLGSSQMAVLDYVVSHQFNHQSFEISSGYSRFPMIPYCLFAEVEHQEVVI